MSADLYQRVTDQIIALLEAGAKANDWRRPWNTTANDPFSPINVASRKPYRGVNTVNLWATAQAKAYTGGEWGTFKQWKEIGAHVRRGEKSALCVFWKFSRETDDELGEVPNGKQRPVMTNFYHVFNSDQVEGYEPRVEDLGTETQRIARADKFLKKVGAKLKHAGNRAFYNRGDDSITLPRVQQFHSIVDYYSTSFHEHTHWTGHASRLDREMGKRFGDMAYAAEELVAELGAAFLCARLGIENNPREDHAQYIDSWLKVLRKDSRAIFIAAGRAQRAADLMLTLGGIEAAESVAA
jgi:antirestriction protein ArdC